ncbi:hypothetical protein [Candidatus Villigracilis saccharophilus]|uniref:hypothetical protein n=1 Tax=Candidatus Villigracilis saccharophilus TaxID=3140684 RepID=UPI003135490B|nr:hypothetical protein [Anaerolineales bacterium]
MPGPTPSRRLVKFRGTQDFALVKNKRGSNQNNGGIVWSSCQTQTGAGGSGGGGGTQMQTAFGKTKMRQDLETIGQGIAMLGLGQSATGFLAPIGVPVFAVGVIFGIAASSIKKVTFTRPCIDPELMEGLRVGFDEPDFNTFQQQYAAYLADQSRNAQNATPLEAQ